MTVGTTLIWIVNIDTDIIQIPTEVLNKYSLSYLDRICLKKISC